MKKKIVSGILIVGVSLIGSFTLLQFWKGTYLATGADLAQKWQVQAEYEALLANQKELLASWREQKTNGIPNTGNFLSDWTEEIIGAGREAGIVFTRVEPERQPGRNKTAYRLKFSFNPPLPELAQFIYQVAAADPLCQISGLSLKRDEQNRQLLCQIELMREGS